MRSLASFATALLLAVSCASDPDVVVDDEGSSDVVFMSGVASYVDLQTIRFTADDGAKFSPIASLTEADKLAECFKVTVSCEEKSGEEMVDGVMTDIMETIYSADFTGCSLAVDSDGSLLVEVSDPYLSSSDKVQLSYKRDNTLSDLAVEDGQVLKSFSYLEVEGTNDGSQSYEVANWVVKKGDTQIGVFPIEYVITGGDVTGADDYTFTDLSNSGDGKDLYVASQWLNIAGEVVDGTSMTVTAEQLEARGTGINTVSMHSVFTRPVYAYVDGVRIYSYKVIDDSSEYKGLYQLDKDFEFKVYPTQFTAGYKLFNDAAMMSAITEETATVNVTVDGAQMDIPCYKINVGSTFYMSDQSYPLSPNEVASFDINCKWEFDSTSMTTTGFVSGSTNYYESSEMDSDMAKAMFYQSATTGEYVVVKFTASDDRTGGGSTSEDTVYFALDVALDESSALYTAQITGESEITLTLKDPTHKISDAVVDSSFGTTFIARRLSVDSSADSKGYISAATYTTTTSSDVVTQVELRSETVTRKSDTELTLEFPMKFYDGEVFSLIYDGYTINYLGETSDEYKPFELATLDSNSEPVTLVSDVPVPLVATSVTLAAIPEFNYLFKFVDPSLTGLDFSNTVYEPTSCTMVVDAGATTTAKFAMDDAGNNYADFGNLKWSMDGGTTYTTDSGDGAQFTLSEGTTTIDLYVESTRPCNYPTKSNGSVNYNSNPCFFSNQLSLANNVFRVTKSITVNVYSSTFSSIIDDLDFTVSSDVAGESALDFSPQPIDDSYTNTTATLSTNAGNPVYYRLNTFGVDSYTIVESSGSEYCTISYVNESGVKVTNGTSDIIKIDFSKDGDYELVLTAQREPHEDDSVEDKVAAAGKITCTIAATVTGDLPLDATLSYNATTSVYITLDNGSTFVPSGINLTSLAEAFKVYYDDSFSEASMLTVKSVAFTTSNTRLQITLSGGTTHRMYGDDVVYVTYDGSVTVPTSDSFGRTLPVYGPYTGDTLADALTEGTVSDTTLAALTLGSGGVANTVITTDDSFDFDNLPYQDLSYTGVGSTTEGVWSYGESSTSYTEAAVVPDPTDSSKRCIKLIGDSKVSAKRALYNGTHFSLSNSVQYKASFKMLIPHDVTMDDTTSSTGQNLRPSFYYKFGTQSAFTWGSHISAITVTYSNYSSASKIGQWQYYESTLKSYDFAWNGSVDYNRLGIVFTYYDDDVYIRDLVLEKYETRPKN